jgi:hypothetical protein
MVLLTSKIVFPFFELQESWDVVEILLDVFCQDLHGVVNFEDSFSFFFKKEKLSSKFLKRKNYLRS